MISAKWFVWTRDIVLLAVVFLGITAWQQRDMLEADGSVYIEQQNMVSLNGEVVPLLATDKPNLVYFFAPWCQICALSIGNLDYLNSDEINIVVVALDYTTKEEVAEFVNTHQVKSEVLMGNLEIKQAFSVQGYPSYYLIDKDQKVVSSSYGYSTALGLKLREAFGK
jgi:thiol-disulfide isomerase/thioredoxin